MIYDKVNSLHSLHSLFSIFHLFFQVLNFKFLKSLTVRVRNLLRTTSWNTKEVLRSSGHGIETTQWTRYGAIIRAEKLERKSSSKFSSWNYFFCLCSRMNIFDEGCVWLRCIEVFSFFFVYILKSYLLIKCLIRFN